MAKLNGVKTLDMVNGEITKVSYEGAEYAKVGGISSDVISEGDIAYVKTSRTAYFDAKSFYEFVEHADNGNYIFKDNYGHRTGISSFNDRAVIFRKISADKPTLEQRVEMLESDVAALKSSDSSLKGEKKSTSTFKVGDSIKVVANTASHGSKDKAGFHELGQGIVYVGAVGKVKSVKGNYVKAKFAPKDVDQNYETLVKKLRFDEIELVAHSEETIEFEGATYRKVDREAREGDVVIFKGVECQSSYTEDGVPYKVIAENTYVLEDGDGYSISGWDYHSVDVYEPIEQSKYVPQEGDIVVITGNRCDSRNAVGDIGKITKVKSYGINVEVPSKPDGSGVNGNSHPFDEVRKATPAEVEQYEQALKDAEIAKKWAKIGRKPNEFKKGDVIEITREQCGSRVGTVTTVVSIINEGDGVTYKADRANYGADVTAIKLLAPVESLFNVNA